METNANLLPALVNPLTYPAYLKLTEALLLAGKTTGTEQTEEKINATVLNAQRMKRVQKHFSLLPELQEVLENIPATWNWLLLIEAWCGDGAQLLPAIAGIAEAFPQIKLTLLLRDENPELMDRFLTNGGRAIPKLICQDTQTRQILFTWGPRPAAIQKMVTAFKTENPEATKDELHAQLAGWYAKDKSQSLQQDLLGLVTEAIRKPALAEIVMI